MKQFLRIVLLAVLLVSVLGAIPVMAGGKTMTDLSCGGPAGLPPFAGEAFRITGTLADGTSGTPVPDRLITVYMLTDEKKWVEIGSNTTSESGQYAVMTRQDTADTYSFRAEFAGDKGFRKSVSPAATVRVIPLPRLILKGPVTNFKLINDGGFVAKLACYYSTDNGTTWRESDHTGGIGISKSVTTPLDTLGVPEGALVKIHVIVVGGNDKTGSTVFEYLPDTIYWDGPTYEYSIYGTTLNPKLMGPYGPFH